MKAYQLKCLAWTFSALLPPSTNEDNDDDDDDYYTLLGVSTNATPDEIRRAYKKKSLMLHPDKIQQRTASNIGSASNAATTGSDQDEEEEKLHAKFQHMKEAYECLSDPHKREIYDALGKRGLKFWTNPTEAFDPNGLLKNLALSSCWDRSKLMVLVILILGLVFVQPILICIKVDHLLEKKGGLEETDWILILIPLWVLDVMGIVVLITTRHVMLTMEFVSFVVGEVFLALKWDNTLDWKYYLIFIPFYTWDVLRLIHGTIWIRRVSSDTSKMVTTEYLEKHVLSTPSSNDEDDDEEGNHHRRLYSDLTDDERDEINERYIIVHVPPNATNDIDSDDDNLSNFSTEVEADRVRSSPEYEGAIKRLTHSIDIIRSVILYHSSFLVLLIMKLDHNKDWSWWLVFVPIWVMIGMKMGGSCWVCCCAGVGGGGPDNVVLLVDEDEDDEEKEEEEKEEEEKKKDEQEGEDDGEKDVEEKEDEEVVAAAAAEKEKEEEDEKEEEMMELLPPPPSGSYDDDAGGIEVVGSTSEEAAEAGGGPDGAMNNNNVAAAGGSDAPSPEGKKSTLSITVMDSGEEKTPEGDEGGDAAIITPTNANGSGGAKAAIPTVNDNVEEINVVNAAAAISEEDEDDDEDGIHIDADTYHAWQQAHAEAESHAVEAQSKAMGTCCVALLQVTVLCLFVGKLAQVDEEESDENQNKDGTDSYSAVWILFPFLVMGGTVLCCFGCAIYCARDVDGLEEMMGRKQPARTEGEEDGDEEVGGGNMEEENMAMKSSSSRTEGPIVIPPPVSTPSTVDADAGIELSDNAEEDVPASSAATMPSGGDADEPIGNEAKAATTIDSFDPDELD